MTATNLSSHMLTGLYDALKLGLLYFVNESAKADFGLYFLFTSVLWM